MFRFGKNMLGNGKLKLPITKIGLSVKYKLYFGFILVAALGALIGTMGYTKMNSLGDEYEFIISEVFTLKDIV